MRNGFEGCGAADLDGALSVESLTQHSVRPSFGSDERQLLPSGDQAWRAAGRSRTGSPPVIGSGTICELASVPTTAAIHRPSGDTAGWPRAMCRV